MSEIVNYNGYIAKIDVDVKKEIVYGEVINLKDVIAFEGETVPKAVEAFHRAVDGYLAYCKKAGLEPEKQLSGKIPFRTSPEHHHLIFTAARLACMSVNAWMDWILTKAAEEAVQGSEAKTRPLVYR